MKKILLCILGFFIIILQNSIINYLSVFGMTINIVLIYLVIISLYLDELESGIIGAVLGIILDSSVGGLFGSNGLIFFGYKR
jgi:rod shape-determining protein MreD